MNKEDAEKEIEKWKEERVKVFCPLIKDRCKLDCECMVNKVIYKSEKLQEVKYKCTGGYCSCYILHGEYLWKTE